MHKSFFRKTLCALLIAGTVSNVSAQKKSSDFNLAAFLGAKLSSSFNPIFSLGLGSETKYYENSLSIHGDVGMFIGGIPFQTYSREFPATIEGHNFNYTEELATTPKVQSTISFSYNSVSFGGGAVFAKKSCTIPSGPFAIPNLDNGYTANVVGPCATIGVNITNSLWCEANIYYLFKTKGSKTLAQTDKDFISFSGGFIYELTETEKNKSHHHKHYH